MVFMVFTVFVKEIYTFENDIKISLKSSFDDVVIFQHKLYTFKNMNTIVQNARLTLFKFLFVHLNAKTIVLYRN